LKTYGGNEARRRKASTENLLRSIVPEVLAARADAHAHVVMSLPLVARHWAD